MDYNIHQKVGRKKGVDEKPSDVDNMPYTTLLYANGPGYNHNFPNGRENLTAVNHRYSRALYHVDGIPMEVKMSQSMLMDPWPISSGASFEQTYVPHALAFASCIGPQRDDCERRRQSYHRQLIECPSVATRWRKT
ncbi:alkaline phosphatase [Caerostris extrusa]|uniref:Alkaline phosphatase n=1 Tax=Caerostris extrusa TaxID=172846 RepID=A0AAV4MWS7_CAEEX|nr:alkaline phosphatase [Caerostris extrusa]